MKRLLTLVFLLCALTAAGQTKEKDSFFRDLSAFLDMRENKAYLKTDTTYVGRYPYHWNGRVFYKSTGLHMVSTFGSNFSLSTGLCHRVGLGISYRGLGLSYSHAIGKKINLDLGVDSYGKHFCFEFALRATRGIQGSVLEGADSGEGDPTLLSSKLNLFYSFIPRFSYGAAMKQSKIQRRSAGSFIAAISWWAGDIILLDENPSLKDFYDYNYFYQRFSVGAGYGYNLVLGRQHWLLHASLVPMWSVYEMQSWRRKEVRESSIYPYGKIAFSGTARAGVYYRWTTRWSIGFSGVVNQLASVNYLSSKNPDYKRFGAQEWQMNVILNCRF